MVDQDRTSYYAVLVGIDAYSERPLKGCVRDVHEIKKLLDDIPEPGVQTHVLTARLITDTAEVLPTYCKVVDTINHIIDHAKEGDFVYIHYSGHGTVCRPPLPSSPFRAFSNPSTGDLALNLLEENGSGIRYLRGSELAELLKRMSDKKLVVTLVLDCCFSGSFMRNDASVRYLDYDQEVDAAYPLVLGQNLSSGSDLRRSVYRNASLQPNWLVNPDGYTVITACGPTEKAREIRIYENVYRGAFSRFLTDAFERFGGIGGKHHHIHQFLRARFRNTQRKYRHNQTPMLYGNKNLYFLGRVNPRIEPAPIPVIRNEEGGFQLEAGQAHGICEGDEFTIRSVAFDGSMPESKFHEGSYTARVSSVRALTSSLELSDMIVVHGLTLTATTRTILSLQKYPIRLDIGASYPEGWAEALGEQQFLCTYQASNETKDHMYSFNVVLLNDGSYEIQDKTNCILFRLPGSSCEPVEIAALVLKAVEHLSRFELFRSLTNDSSADTANSFRKSFSVRIKDAAGRLTDPGCLQTKDLEAACTHLDCLIEVVNDTSLQLEVVNNEEKGGHTLYMHVYGASSSSWEIENTLKVEYGVLPPKSSNWNPQFTKASSGTWRKKLKMKLPPILEAKGETQCDDIIKIFFTSQPTSLALLELPELGEVMTRRKIDRNRGAGAYSTSEEWAAMSFRIRTRIMRA